MESFLKYLETHDLKRVSGEAIKIDDASSNMLYVVVNPSLLDVEIATNLQTAQLVLVSDSKSQGVEIKMSNGAKLNLVEVLYKGGESSVNISQDGDSQLKATLIELESSTAKYEINLSGRGAESEMSILQLTTEEDISKSSLRIAHMSPDCTSRSLSKCVASGSSTAIFNGLIYVAQDAQRTLADQNSRNVSLSESAHIIAEPQLEIYADDVKCSHGATVGQMNSDALYYMQQRGLSEDQARKLQLDGFVSDVTQRCGIETLREALSEMVRERLGVL